MTPITAPSLDDLTQRYCARAQHLARDPALTTAEAAAALDHLARLQANLAADRLRQTAQMREALKRMEAPFVALEHALKAARADMSEALLRAVPDPSQPYGQVPHGAIAPAQGPAPQAMCASRALLDLEALRPYLTQTALSHAIARRTRESGRADVAGVTYGRLPASAHLPCAVF